MANIALDAGKVVLKDGKASCSCCVVCPPIDNNYTVISEAMYNSLQAGGTLSWSGGLTEGGFFGPIYCSFTDSGNNELTSGNCGFSVLVTGPNQGCTPSNYLPFIDFGLSIYKFGNEHRLTYGGSAACNGPAFEPVYNFCYSVGWAIDWSYDNGFPPYPSIITGNININTSAGTLGPFGMWTFANAGTGFLDITITPPPPPP
jgi:hypothetical protein